MLQDDRYNSDLKGYKLPLRHDILGVTNVSVQYGNNNPSVISGVNLTVQRGEILTFIGPSGCGKSSLLKCFNRGHEFDIDNRSIVTGQILFDGVDITKINIEALTTNIGFVFQKPNPFPKSIFDNVAFGLRLQGVNNQEIKNIVEDSLIRAGLWGEVKDNLKKPALRLSGGQQQRLCIARALALRPQVLLLDEPTSSLDPISARGIEETIMSLKQDNITVIFVTHNIE
jgi:phosphate transport system ATP-binding protein